MFVFSKGSERGRNGFVMMQEGGTWEWRQIRFAFFFLGAFGTFLFESVKCVKVDSVDLPQVVGTKEQLSIFIYHSLAVQFFAGRMNHYI